MILAEISKTRWFQDNLEALTRTKLAGEPQVKHCLALLANSQFKECSEVCELWLLASDKARDLWRSGTPPEWLAEAYAFATTVAVVTGTIAPKGAVLKVLEEAVAVDKAYSTKEASNGAA